MLFGTIPIQNVTRQMINSEVTTLTKYSQSVISKVWQQMNGAYEEAKLRRIVNENPFGLKNYIIKPKFSIPTKVIDSLTIEEEKRFIAELEKGLDTDPSGADISLIINMSGDVMYIDFGPSIGCGPFTIDNTNSDFEEQVRWFMEKLLEEDLEVFKIMRSVLVGKWLEMAESVTKDIMH